MTEIETIKRYLGEIIPLLLSYDQYFMGWKIGVELLKEEVKNCSFIIMTDIALPFRKFYLRIKNTGFDIIREGENGNLAVITTFGEIPEYDFIYNIGKVDEATFIPKYSEARKQILEQYNLKSKRRKIIHVFATLDALYEQFGSSLVKKLLRSQLIADEKMIGEYDFWSMFVVNRDVIPNDLHSWVVSLSDYVILTRGVFKDDEFIENVAILKGAAENFTPLVLQVKTPATEISRKTLSTEVKSMKYTWKELAEKMGIEVKRLENKEAKELKKFVDNLAVPTHCHFCQGLDLRIENPVHHPSYELTPACNHDCIFCYSNVAVKLGKAPKPGYYGWENPKAITISQYGEPLISPRIVEVNRMLRKRFPRARLDLQTNGSLLTEELWQKLDFDLVMISLDAATREMHLKITNADTFEKVVEALRIVGMDKSARSVVRTVFMPGINDEEIPKIAELASSLGIDEMMLQPLTIHQLNEERLRKAGLDFERAESIRELLKTAMEAKKYIDVRISGCLLVQLKKMDALTLYNVYKVSRDVAPLVKRKKLDEVDIL